MAGALSAVLLAFGVSLFTIGCGEKNKRRLILCDMANGWKELIHNWQNISGRFFKFLLD
jgi:hypothetical protein